MDICFSKTLNSCKVPQIRYASVERLLERLTDLRFLSIDFLNTFLHTYRIFTTATVVIDKLTDIYKKPFTSIPVRCVGTSRPHPSTPVHPSIRPLIPPPPTFTSYLSLALSASVTRFLPPSIACRSALLPSRRCLRIEQHSCDRLSIMSLCPDYSLKITQLAVDQSK